jgi:hypothetical protein
MRYLLTSAQTSTSKTLGREKMLNPMSRSLLNLWGWIGIAPGYRYVAVEQFGQNFLLY